MIEKRVFRSEVKGYDDDRLILDHFISTESSDRTDDVMLVDGMKMRGMPVVLEQHGLDPKAGMEPIAKPLSLTIGVNKDGVKGIIAKTQYFPDDTGRRLYTKAKDGYMPYWSIGFNVMDYSPRANGGRTVKSWELMEYSQVSCPANPEATMIKSVDMLPKTDEEFEKANIQFAFGIKVAPTFTGERVEDLEKKDKAIANIKSVFDRVKTSLPSSAMEQICYAMMNEMWMVADESMAEAIIGEVAGLLLPYAKAFMSAIGEDRDSMKSIIDLHVKNLSPEPVAAEQAPTTPEGSPETEPLTPPEDDTVLELVPPEPEIEMSVDDVKVAVCKGLADSAMQIIRKAQGKLD